MNVFSKVINALSNAYFCLYYYDLNTKEYEEIFAPDYMERMIPREGNGIEALEEWIRTSTLMEDDSLKKYQDAEYIRKKFASSNVIDYEVLTNTVGWIRILYIAAERGMDGRAMSMLLAAQNIDEEKQDELDIQRQMKSAYEEANRAKAAQVDFISKMSHDIRTPLNCILGLAMIAKSHPGDIKKAEYCIDRIEDSGQHILGIVNDLFDISKIEADKIELIRDEFMFESMIEDVRKITEPLAKVKGQQVIFDYSEISPRHRGLYADKIRLEEILTNLVSNAIKFSPDGSEITVTATSERNAGHIRDYIFCVKDHGIGMSPSFIGRLFQPFSREDITNVMKIDGSGLGLSIAKKYIDAMNGSIEVKSERGKGSEFTVTIPLFYQELFTTENPEVELSDLDYKGKRLLLAEDNDLNAEIETEILGMTGIEIERVNNGAVAVTRFEETKEGYYDIIFMDIEMPVLNGYYASVAIRGMGKKDSGTIPIVAMTAHAFAADIREAEEAGMNAHISKPIDVDKLARILKKLLG